MSTRRKPQSRNPAARPEDRAARPEDRAARPEDRAARPEDRAARLEERESRGPATAPDDNARGRSSAADSASKVAAVGLWVVVGGGLVYGVSQTLVKVVALFGG